MKLTLLLTTTFISPFAPLGQDDHAGRERSAIDKFYSSSVMCISFAKDDKPKQGFEEPKFVPLRGQVMPLIALYPAEVTIFSITRHTFPWQTMAPHDALHTSNSIASAIYDSIAQ